jgi:hypothetical protein
LFLSGFFSPSMRRSTGGFFPARVSMLNPIVSFCVFVCLCDCVSLHQACLLVSLSSWIFVLDHYILPMFSLESILELRRLIPQQIKVFSIPHILLEI